MSFHKAGGITIWLPCTSPLCADNSLAAALYTFVLPYW